MELKAYEYPVEKTVVVGLSVAIGSVILLVGLTLSTAGLALGAWMAERFGRVHSVVGLGFAMMFGELAFNWGPPARFTRPALASDRAWMVRDDWTRHGRGGQLGGD
jgi:hypothetical protein